MDIPNTFAKVTGLRKARSETDITTIRLVAFATEYDKGDICRNKKNGYVFFVFLFRRLIDLYRIY